MKKKIYKCEFLLFIASIINTRRSPNLLFLLIDSTGLLYLDYKFKRKSFDEISYNFSKKTKDTISKKIA